MDIIRDLVCIMWINNNLTRYQKQSAIWYKGRINQSSSQHNQTATYTVHFIASTLVIVSAYFVSVMLS